MGGSCIVAVILIILVLGILWRRKLMKEHNPNFAYLVIGRLVLQQIMNETNLQNVKDVIETLLSHEPTQESFIIMPYWNPKKNKIVPKDWGSPLDIEVHPLSTEDGQLQLKDRDDLDTFKNFIATIGDEDDE